MALLAAAVAHTPEGEEVLRGARMRMARKPSAVARELMKNFPKGGRRRRRRKRSSGERAGSAKASGNGAEPNAEAAQDELTAETEESSGAQNGPEPGAGPDKAAEEQAELEESGEGA